MSDDVAALFRKLSICHALTIEPATTTEKNGSPYITQLTVQSGVASPKVALACTDDVIRLYSHATLDKEQVLSGHSGNVTDVKFGRTDGNLLFSCSSDKTIRCWDMRLKGKEAQKFKAPLKGDCDLLSLDVNQSEALVAAGTETGDGDDTHLLFWDRRAGSLLGSYTDCHDDAITRVSFQSGSDTLLASAGADGIVCVFDLSNESEDDALQMTFNIEACVDKLGWDGTDVYSITSDHRYYAWDALQGDDKGFISRESILQEGERDYVVDLIPGASNGGTLLLTGNHCGKLSAVLRSESGEVNVISTLSERAHTDTVRCLHWDPLTNRLLTGGEDSRLCLWSVQDQSIPKAMGKMSIQQNQGARKKPYDKKKGGKR